MPPRPFLPALLLLLPLTGCIPPAPRLMPEYPTALDREAGVLAIQLDRSPEVILPKLLEALQDLRCQVTSVEPRLGHVAFRKTWVDESRFSRPKHIITGTLLLQTMEGGRSRLRLLGQGWTEVEESGAHGTHVSRSQETALAPEDGQRFLETLRTHLLR